jgi:hypothetical protein
MALIAGKRSPRLPLTADDEAFNALLDERLAALAAEVTARATRKVLRMQKRAAAAAKGKQKRKRKKGTNTGPRAPRPPGTGKAKRKVPAPVLPRHKQEPPT